jgi:hypothetical protein
MAYGQGTLYAALAPGLPLTRRIIVAKKKKNDRPDPSPEAFEPLIEGFVAVACGYDEDGFLRRALEEAMAGMAKEGIDIRGPIGRIWEGERDYADLTKGLSELELIPVRGTLAALEQSAVSDFMNAIPPALQEAIMDGDEEKFAAALETIPEEEQAALFEMLANSGILGQPNVPLEGALYHEMVEPLLIAIAEVANGVSDPEIKEQIAEELTFLAHCERDISEPVERIWKGERDRAVLCQGLDDETKVLVERILVLIGESGS